MTVLGPIILRACRVLVYLGGVLGARERSVRSVHLRQRRLYISINIRGPVDPGHIIHTLRPAA